MSPDLQTKYKSKLRLLQYYKNEKKTNLVERLIESVKKEITEIEKQIAAERNDLI